jgi:cytochrome c-type biogenesis protein CcmE
MANELLKRCAFPYIPLVKPRTKFLIGGVLVIGTAGYLAASAIKDTGVYYLTPGELSAKTKSDPTFYETRVKAPATQRTPL